MNEIFLPEILQIILLHLPLPEIVRFRLVSKNAKFIVDNFIKLNSLTIYTVRPPINCREFYTNKPIECRHSIKIVECKDDLLRRSLFASIKQLTTNSDFFEADLITCELLNSFQSLRSLELANFCPETNDTLNLQSLEILTIKFSSTKSQRNELTLDAIKLKRLKVEFHAHMNLRLVHPETIIYLRTNFYHKYIKSFINLEVLICDEIEELDSDLFSSLEKLKEFHFDRELALFNDLKSQAKSLQRNDLKIYLKGIEFESIDGQQFSDESSKQIINHLFVNLNKIADIIPFVKYLEYDYLDDGFERQVPVELVRKFVDLELIILNRTITDTTNLVDFLGNLNAVRWLKFKNTSLDQEFYRCLVDLCPNVEFIKIKDEKAVIDTLDFNFLFKLKFLCTITTNKCISFDMVEKIFRELKYIRLIKFPCRKDTKTGKIMILRNGDELEIMGLKDLNGLEMVTTLDRLLDDLRKVFSTQ